ncbi:MAG: fibronectin type III domain-containing protein [Candidatus Nanopelagicales bacterium]
MKRFVGVGATALALCLIGSTAPAFAATIAQEPAPTVIAVDASPATTQILANRINGITVSGTDGGLVAAQANGHVTRSVRIRAGQSAVITNLDPGARYAVTLDGKRIGFAIPVGQVGAANGLKVETTDVPGQVQLTWTHTINKDEGVPVVFTVAATAADTSTPTAKTVTTDLHATLSGLNLNERYTFSVTPSNSASAGRISSAAMQQTLAQISGVSVDQQVTPAPSASPTPAAAPAPAPSPAPTPATTTIYVCPDGFADAGSLCQKTLAYTFHPVVTSTPYTYHQTFVQTGTHVDYSASPNGGTYYAENQWNANDGSPAGYYAVVPDGYSITAKDAPPAGYTDNGTAFVKTDQVKDSTPAGYTDSGSAWVMTTAKTAQVVPA